MKASLGCLVLLGAIGCGPTSGGRRSAAPPSGDWPVEPMASDGTAGACRAMAPAAAGDGEGAANPAEIANCPDVDALSRGDGIGASDDLPPVEPSELPDWNLDELRDFACAYACAKEGAQAYLLAWYVIEDGRPLRNHNALFVVAHPAAADAAPRWTVVVMYRHATNTWWNVAFSFHSRARPIHDFDHRPSPAEIYAVLDENDWVFADDDDWHVLAGNVIDPLWPAASGAPATRFYPDAIER